MERPAQQPTGPQARLSLWDTTSLIVGIIVGVGIFFTPQSVFKNTPGVWEALALWLLAGVLCLLGAFCFAELASTYPRSGGEYVYLSRALGPWAGFLFGWAQLTVIRAGAAIGVIAFAFGSFAAGFFDVPRENTVFPCAVAAGGVALLTLVNMLGVRSGKHTQNTLTVLKIAGLGVLLVAGFFFGKGPAGLSAPPAEGGRSWALLSGLTVALISILWTYSGWHEAAYVVAEIQDRRRTVPRALLFGTSVVILLYLAVNLACAMGVGFGAARRSDQLAADVLAGAFGGWAGRVMSLLIMLSALGALNGTILTSSRIYAAMGADHPLFAPLGRWHPRRGTPVVALAVQGALTIAFVLFVGLFFQGYSGFEVLILCTAAVFWLFFLLTMTALFVLRRREPHVARPFRVPLYPLTPILFCLCCVGMLVASIVAAPQKSLIGLGLLVSGAPFYFLSQRLKRARTMREGKESDSGQREVIVSDPEAIVTEGERP